MFPAAYLTEALSNKTLYGKRIFSHQHIPDPWKIAYGVISTKTIACDAGVGGNFVDEKPPDFTASYFFTRILDIYYEVLYIGDKEVRQFSRPISFQFSREGRRQHVVARR